MIDSAGRQKHRQPQGASRLLNRSDGRAEPSRVGNGAVGVAGAQDMSAGPETILDTTPAVAFKTASGRRLHWSWVPSGPMSKLALTTLPCRAALAARSDCLGAGDVIG